MEGQPQCCGCPRLGQVAGKGAPSPPQEPGSSTTSPQGLGESPGTGISPLCKSSACQSKTLWPLRAAQGVATTGLGCLGGSLPQNIPHHQHIPSCSIAAAPFPSPRGFGASSGAATPTQGSRASSATSHPLTPEGPTQPAQIMATITLPRVPPAREAAYLPKGAVPSPRRSHTPGKGSSGLPPACPPPARPSPPAPSPGRSFKAGVLHQG